MEKTVNVLVWNEFIHEKSSDAIRKIYPDGIHGAIATHLNAQEGIVASTATLDEPEHGLSESALARTDVLIWWGHAAHNQVKDEVVQRVHSHVLAGMGIICLHSAHFSKIFKSLMGTSCALKWREIGEKERLWNIEPSHPIAEGMGDYFELPHTEMYGERFDIPTPEKVIFISWFPGGEVFRSGCIWQRGHGKIFYFRPGHETYPIYHDQNVLKVITNAVRWAAPKARQKIECLNVKPLEKVG
jgi:trehalose utilization protein